MRGVSLIRKAGYKNCLFFFFIMLLIGMNFLPLNKWDLELVIKQHIDNKVILKAEGSGLVSSSFFHYVIITTKAIKNGSAKLDDFVAHKQKQGFNVSIVTEDDFGNLTGQPPNGTAEKIRQWLINNYIKMSIRYVLLIGDPDPDNPLQPNDHVGDIPMKTCILSRNTTTIIMKISSLFFLKSDIPTDYFYADLTGNWDYDGDQIYGEYVEDYLESGYKGVDFASEVFVGRIPVYNNNNTNYSDLDHILQKTIDYEKDTGDLSWRKHVLLPMCFVKFGYDFANLGEQIKDDLLIPNNFLYWRMYQNGSDYWFQDSLYPSDEELRDGLLKERWSKDHFGIVCWTGHGNATLSIIGSNVFSAGVLFSTDDCRYLDDDHPAFTFQVSCDNGRPEDQNNLGYSLLVHGAIATVSGTRPTVAGFEKKGEFTDKFSSGSIAFNYLKNLITGCTAGESLYKYKMNLSIKTELISYMQNIYGYNLFGDPSLTLFNIT